MARHLDKTWQEIYDAVTGGKDVSIISFVEEYGDNDEAIALTRYSLEEIIDSGPNYADSARYAVYVVVSGDGSYFTCDSPDDYPVLDDSDGNSGSDNGSLV